MEKYDDMAERLSAICIISKSGHIIIHFFKVIRMAPSDYIDIIIYDKQNIISARSSAPIKISLLFHTASAI